MSVMVEEVSCYKTTDGTLYEDKTKALQWQAKLDFMAWCSDNICMGGPWTAKMVADAILESWQVLPKK